MGADGGAEDVGVGMADMVKACLVKTDMVVECDLMICEWIGRQAGLSAERNFCQRVLTNVKRSDGR